MTIQAGLPSPTKRFARFIGALLILACSANLASAGSIAYSNSVVSSGIQGWNGNLGLDFIVNQSINISHLGAFDNGNLANLIGYDGNSGVQVGIFNSAGALMGAAVTLTPSSAAAAIGANTGEQIAGDFFVEVTPFTLLPGAYSVVAFNSVNYNSGLTNTSAATFDNGGGLVTLDPGLNVRWDNGSGLALPTANVGVYGPDPRFGAGTFVFEEGPPPPQIDGIPAYDNAIVGSGQLQNWQGNLGLDFTVNNPIDVHSLGVFNNGSLTNLWGVDGTSGVMVGIYNTATSTLVTPMLTVTPDSIGRQINGDFFVPINPVTLGPGQYSVVTFNDKNYNSGFNNTAAGTMNDGGGLLTLSPNQSIRWDNAGAFGLPTSNVGLYGPDPRFNSGTFTFSEASGPTVAIAAVPEPSSLVVMLGLMGLGFCYSSRSRGHRLDRRATV